jgi:uncharacterized protein (TIGR02301 family)
MTGMRMAGLATMALLVAASPALAQKVLKPVPLLKPNPPAATAPGPAPAPAPTVNAQPGAAPPYEDQILRLAEILGGLHYLRHLCQSGEGEMWREQMQALIESENADEIERRRMVDRFNHGYESFRSVYLACTPAAAEVSDRYLDEGARIAADITARYGK